MLFSAGLCEAANIDTFAKVNLVKGIEARLSIGDLNDELEGKLGDPALVSLSGPADYCVEVQMSALDSESQWTDKVSSEGIKFATSHDSLGNLNLDLAFDGLDSGDDTGQKLVNPTTRYIVTLTYE